jgi:MerR family transcriptional regulator, thiopeptide resistance regulator
MTTSDGAGEAGTAWKVGALARATGLTVRTLHYYEHIGLLTPSRRSPAGHRLYDGEDVARLYRVSLLRRLGFPLDQITGVLDDPEWQLAPAVDRHLSHTQDRAAITARLCTRLAAMAAELARQDNPSPEQLFSTLEEPSATGRSGPATRSSACIQPPPGITGHPARWVPSPA